MIASASAVNIETIHPIPWLDRGARQGSLSSVTFRVNFFLLESSEKSGLPHSSPLQKAQLAVHQED
jgi:hypothetical protein